MSAQRELPQEAGYNLRLRHPDHAAHFAVWEAESARVRAALACTLDVRYGAGPDMTADLFPAPAAGAPIQVFIHGGYWRAMDKASHSFPAEGFVAAGGAAVSLNYALAPSVTLDTIVEQCRSALEWVADNAGRLNGDAARIFVSGHSAGGHLSAMMLCTDWAARGRAGGLVKGGTAISGIFDLAPLMETSINDDIRLDAGSARRNSPLHNLPACGSAAHRPAHRRGRRGGDGGVPRPEPGLRRGLGRARLRRPDHGDRRPQPLHRGERDGPPRQRAHRGRARPDGPLRDAPPIPRRSKPFLPHIVPVAGKTGLPKRRAPGRARPGGPRGRSTRRGMP